MPLGRVNFVLPESMHQSWERDLMASSWDRYPFQSNYHGQCDTEQTLAHRGLQAHPGLSAWSWFVTGWLYRDKKRMCVEKRKRTAI